MNPDFMFPALLIRRIGWAVIHFTWQGAVIAVMTAGLLALLRKADARIRYAVGCAALAAIVILPVVTVFLKNPNPFPYAGLPQGLENHPVDIQEFYTDQTITSRQYRSQAIPVSLWTTAVTFCENHLSGIAAIWVSGVFLFSFYRLAGFFQLFFIIRKIREPIDKLWEKRIRAWIRRLNIHRTIRILQSNRIDTPAVCGWIKPVLLIPVSFLTGMDVESLEPILIHELAHIRRYDYLVNMFQVMIEALGFFHPAVWWLSNRIRREREDCCDDWSVRVLGDWLIYAKSLVSLEEKRRCPQPAMAANGSELSRRVMRILDYPCTQQNASAIFTFGFSLCLAGLFLFTGFRFQEVNAMVHTDRLRNHLTMYYPLDGDARDMSGSGNHGSVKEALPAVDRFGRKDHAYTFNGKNALILAKGTGKLSFSGSVTVCCWIKPHDAASYASWVTMSYAGTKRSQWRSGFGPKKNTEWGFTETVADEGRKIWTDYLITQSEIPLNEWTHVAAVADQEHGEITLYKNGRKTGSIDRLLPYVEDKTFLLIGFQADNPAYFSGCIDEVRIYDTALYGNEVYTVYKMN